VVEGAALLPGRAEPGPDAIEIADRTVAIRGVCGPTRARFHRQRGEVRIRARWRACGTAARHLRLHAVIDAAACKAMTGRLAARAPVLERAFQATRAVRLLVFTRTEGFRHPSIADAVRVLGALPVGERIAPAFSEDPAVFTDDGLARFDVVAFVNTTGDVLDPPEEGALERFVRSGRGFLGVHSAADTEYGWPWYGRLVGAYFTSHPILPVEVTVTTEDPHHPSTAHLPATFSFTDEIYNFDRNPRADNAILLTIDEAGFIYPNFPIGRPSMGADHPVAWYKEYEGGRSFYSNLGHRPETWDDPRFRAHLLAAIHWAAGPVSYNRIVLTGKARNPVALAVAPDGRVFYIERTGEVAVWHPDTGQVIDAARLRVDTTAENGLLGITLDPGFAANRWLYLYHSEPVPEPPPPGPPGENVLSRFTAHPDGTLDLSSRLDLLRVPSERECCHEGGGLAFAPDGTLFLSTGDNTNPFASEGAAPLDERPGHERNNAQRTAANPFDLRGKILRINPDGTLPPGNLFPSGAGGRPEIFTMGNRNPFRIAVDPATGRLFWGEVGPDAPLDRPRGPRGYDEINFADAPGNYGWPYCIADNLPYADYDFATGTVGPPFSCAGMVPALLAYDYLTVSHLALGSAVSPERGFLGRTAIAGVFYRPPPGAPYELPAPFADSLLMTDWTRDLLAAVRVDPAGELAQVVRFLPFERFLRPIDLDVGPDGALYVLEYGSGYFGDNDDARLSRVEHSPTGVLTPVALAHASPAAGKAPLDVVFSAAGSRAPGEAIVAYEWDLDGDGGVDRRGPELQRRFRRPGRHVVALVVVGASGRRSFPHVAEVVVGNSPPEVTILAPADGARVPEGTIVTLQGMAVDAEDGPAPCGDLVWDIRLGHNAHSHPLLTRRGCTATFRADTEGGHRQFGGLFFAVELTYTDRGGPGDVPPLTGRRGIRLEMVRLLDTMAVALGPASGFDERARAARSGPCRADAR
jgi:glucose/arabinose dehydrogenase